MQNYSAPSFLQNQSADDIHRRMLDSLPNDLDKSENQFIWDFTRPSALEKAQMIEQQLNETIKTMFPSYAAGHWLDQHASTRGLIRAKATCATGTLLIRAGAGTVIPAGFKFSTPSTIDSAGIEFETVSEFVVPIPDDGSKTGEGCLNIRAVYAGISGNVVANTITIMVKPISGIASVTNPEATSGGTPDEDDESLRERICEYDAKQGESFVGSINDYIRWAREVDGIGSVRAIQPSTDDGVIKLVLTDSTGAPATPVLCEAVYNHIFRPDNPIERLAPVNALLEVSAPVSICVTVSAGVCVDYGYDVQAVSSSFYSALKQYFLNAGGRIIITAIGSVLSRTPGVLDYQNLRVSGGTENIILAVDESPVLESVALYEI